MTSDASVTIEFLDAYADAWNRHDSTAIVAAMTSDCVMQLGAGPDVGGSRFVGQKTSLRVSKKYLLGSPM